MSTEKTNRQQAVVASVGEFYVQNQIKSLKIYAIPITK